MNLCTRCALSAALLSAIGVAHAQDEEGFSGQVAFGYIATSGNSENESLNLGFGGKHVRDAWTHSLDGMAVKASTSGVSTAEAYGLTWQSQYDFSENNYVFGLIDWDKDEFSAYSRQTREVLGYGRRLIESERHVLNGEAGIGARQGDLRDGTSEDEGIARIGLDYEWTISETATFNQTLSVENGSSNTYTESLSSLTADVWGNLAVVFSYMIKNNSDVPIGIEKRDTITAVSLEYSF